MDRRRRTRVVSKVSHAADEIDIPTALAAAESTLRASGEVEHANQMAKRAGELPTSEIRIVVFGEFSRGKSTLINALLGRRVLQAKAMPTTGHVTRIVYDKDERVRALMRDGETHTCTLDDLGSFTTLDLDRNAREDVETIEVAVNCPLLRDKVVFIDTPGVCDAGAQTERARAAIASADLVLLVLHASQLLTDEEQRLAVDWMVRDLGKPVVPVVNWMNVVDERDQPELRERLNRWCRQFRSAPLGHRWFEVNALAALRHVVENGPQPADDFAALRAAIGGLKGAKRRAIQRRSRIGQIRADCANARRCNGQTLDSIQRDANRVKRERTATRRRLHKRIDQLAAQTRLKRQAVTAHAENILGTHLDRLTRSRFASKSKEWLERKARATYEKTLVQAVTAVENRTDQELLRLAGEDLSRPEPVTIKERLVLKARFKSGKAVEARASSQAAGAGTNTGGFLGLDLLPAPVIEALLAVGKYLGVFMHEQEPDYAAAYSKKYSQVWARHAANVKRLLRTQFNARAKALSRQLAEQRERAEVAATDATGLAGEIRRRGKAENALLQLERAIESYATEE
jgi:GTPase SAR1 family protein